MIKIENNNGNCKVTVEGDNITMITAEVCMGLDALYQAIEETDKDRAEYFKESFYKCADERKFFGPMLGGMMSEPEAEFRQALKDRGLEPDAIDEIVKGADRLAELIMKQIKKGDES